MKNHEKNNNQPTDSPTHASIFTQKLQNNEKIREERFEISMATSFDLNRYETHFQEMKKMSKKKPTSFSMVRQKSIFMVSLNVTCLCNVFAMNGYLISWIRERPIPPDYYIIFIKDHRHFEIFILFLLILLTANHRLNLKMNLIRTSI